MIEWTLPWYERLDFQSFETSDGGGGGGLSLSGLCDADADADAVPVLVVDRSDRVLWWLASVLVVVLVLLASLV